jgi:FtsH-binding integral membrane protein
MTESMGLTLFVSKVYTTVGVGLCTTLLTAYISNSIMVKYYTYIYSVLGCMIGLLGLGLCEPLYRVQKSYILRKLSFLLTCFSLGLVMSPIVDNKGHPWLFPNAIIITVMIFGGCTLCAKYCDYDFIKWKAQLLIGLSIILLFQILSLSSFVWFGPNTFISAIDKVDIYVSIFMFMGLIIYDTRMAKIMYERGDPDELYCAMHICLDFINLLVDIIDLMDRNESS